MEILGGFVLHNCLTLCGTQAMSVQLPSALSEVMHPTRIPPSESLVKDIGQCLRTQKSRQNKSIMACCGHF